MRVRLIKSSFNVMSEKVQILSYIHIFSKIAKNNEVLKDFTQTCSFSSSVVGRAFYTENSYYPYTMLFWKYYPIRGKMKNCITTHIFPPLKELLIKPNFLLK